VKDPTLMSAVQVNRSLDVLDSQRAKLVVLLIAAGRGRETSDETYRLSDPLSLRWREVTDRQAALRAEVERRYGHGAPSRLPRGFGPVNG